MIEQSPLRHDDLFHTGIVVDDLEAAKEEFGRLLGVTWLEGGGKVRMSTAEGESVVVTKYAVSAEGPHHVELVQSVPGTLYDANGSATRAPVGYWVDDVPAASAALVRCGLPNVVLISVGGRTARRSRPTTRQGTGSTSSSSPAR